MADGFTVVSDEDYKRLVAERDALEQKLLVTKRALERALDPTWPKEERHGSA